jgi:Protein of unknown function (DUF2752)
MQWRRLRTGELDHELIWLAVSVSGVLVAWVWLKLGLRTPICVFHELTGIACPGCGATRCLRFVFRGQWMSALLMNPMIFVTGVLFVVYDLYAATVLLLRLPRLRFDAIPAWLGWTARVGIPAIILLNWGWLIYSKV